MKNKIKKNVNKKMKWQEKIFRTCKKNMYSWCDNKDDKNDKCSAKQFHPQEKENQH